MPRALIVVRLSRLSDVSTSPERQRDACQELCDKRGYEVVGIAEDLNISAGKTSPFDRPALCEWIGDGKENPGRINEYDTVVFWRADRIVRKVKHLADLIEWADEHGINLVSATEAHFDLSTPMGKVIAQLVASFAEMELDAIRERTGADSRSRIRAGKYRGGIAPWGYLPKQDDSGAWRLVQDPAQVPIIREVVDRVLAGEPLRAIAHDLTARGALTPKDRFAQSQGRAVKGYGWHPGALKRSLTSPTLLGQIVTREPLTDARGSVLRTKDGKKKFGPDAVVRNDDGSPVVRANPILSREVFDRLAVELADRENRKEPTKRSTGLLLQIVHCGVCGRPAYRLKGGAGRKPRYRCASAQYKDPCGNKSILLEYADEIVESILVKLLGESERPERVWDSGSDHSAELTEINETLTDLTGLLGTGVYRAGTPQRVRLNQRIAELAARQSELSATTEKPAGWTWQPTGETFGDWWARQGITARNVWLRSMSIRLEFGSGGVNLDLGDVSQLTEQMNPSGPVAEWQQVFAAMRDNGVQGMTIGLDGDIELTAAE